MSKKTILVTGSAGFIGYHLCLKLVKSRFKVIGIDNINDYYDINLKYSRLNNLGFSKKNSQKFNYLFKSNKYGNDLMFSRTDINDTDNLNKLFKKFKFDIVCNLAAQAGVRYSLKNPNAYLKSNISGFFNILEFCKIFKIKKIVYASSSSVYGNSMNIPFKEIDNVDNPISFYAATKKANELMAYTYSHLYNIETIGLRFFTVYGPWGRPDMAPMLFSKAILNNNTIDVYNKGDLSRDFTYIDDIIYGIYLIINSNKKSKNRIYNIGNGKPVNLLKFIEILEKNIGKLSKKNFIEMQPGDVYKTWACTKLINKEYNYSSKINLENGVKKFTEWYVKYYRIN